MAAPVDDTYETESGGTINAGIFPTWRTGLAVHEWKAIANTALQTHLGSSATYADLRTYHSGSMATAYSGMAFRQSSAEIIIGASGGGASAWAGTDIVGLNLLQDVPAWQTHVAPANSIYVWPNVYGRIDHTFTVNVGASALTVSDVVNGFQNGETFTFPTGTPPAPLTTGVTYHVINASGYAPVTFQVAATSGGSPITLEDAGDSSARIKENGKAHAWTKNNKPNARHAYNQPHFIAVLDEFILAGCQNAWETDDGQFPDVAAWGYGDADWTAKGTYANLWSSEPPSSDAFWSCVDPATGILYYGVRTKFCNRATDGTITSSNYSPSVGGYRDVGRFIFDPVRGTIIGRVDYGGGDYHWWEITTAGAWTEITVTGTSLASGSSRGLVVDTTTGDYYWYQDDGNLYKLSWSGSTLVASQVTTTGTGPTSGWAADSGHLWTRMHYSTKLGGIVLLPKATANVYFVRTH